MSNADIDIGDFANQALKSVAVLCAGNSQAMVDINGMNAFDALPQVVRSLGAISV